MRLCDRWQNWLWARRRLCPSRCRWLIRGYCYREPERRGRELNVDPYGSGWRKLTECRRAGPPEVMR
jgi:hypothetical protein